MMKAVFGFIKLSDFDAICDRIEDDPELQNNVILHYTSHKTGIGFGSVDIESSTKEHFKKTIDIFSEITKTEPSY